MFCVTDRPPLLYMPYSKLPIRCYTAAKPVANLEHDLLPGDKYGRLVVLGDRETEFIHRMVSVRCECGTEFTVRATNVRTGHTTECSVCRRKSAKKKALDSKAAALLAVYRMAMASGGEEAGHVMGFCHRKLIEKAAAAK